MSPTAKGATLEANAPATGSGLLDVGELLAGTATKVVVVCGAGGVGKTTTAAALALRAAEQGRRVVVLTIDPARRLAQALGVTELTNTPQRVELGAGHETSPGGELHAMMLDMRRTFDDMVLENADPDRAQQILTNPFYQTIATSFSGTQEYMAMEKLGQLAASGEWDLVVVDTPPSRSALDFLDAPQRLSSFLDGRMIRLLSAPARAGGLGFRKVVGGAVGLAAKAVSTIIGGQMLSDAAAFVQAFETMFGSFRERSKATYELLRRPSTAFVVISAPEPDALREAAYFVDRLSTEKMPLVGLVLNRTHPTLCTLSPARAEAAADKLEANGSDSLASAVLRVHADRAVTANREVHLLSRFTHAHPRVPLIGVPALPFEVADLDALRALGDELTGVG